MLDPVDGQTGAYYQHCHSSKSKKFVHTDALQMCLHKYVLKDIFWMNGQNSVFSKVFL